jgi:hypothetical protein
MRHRLSSLILASSFFAVAAGVAGWFWSQLFTKPIMHVADQGIMAGTAACAALAGAVAGLLLAPGRDDDGGQPRPSTARITAVILSLGAVAGGFGGALRSIEDIGLGVACGFLYGILLTPAAAVVIPTLGRIGRARRGSVVAWADGRALVAMSSGVLGCTTVIAAFNSRAAVAGGAAPPRLGVILVIAAGVLVALALVIDMAVLARVERWASRLAADDSGAPPELAAPIAGHMDLGLGNEIATVPTPGTAYRGGGRLLASVAGDIDDARSVLRQSIRRGAVLLALLDAVGLAHGMTGDIKLAARYDVWLCDGGHVEECRDAALLAERAGLPAGEAARMHQRACLNQKLESCNALTLMYRQSRPPW